LVSADTSVRFLAIESLISSSSSVFAFFFDFDGASAVVA